MQRLSKASAISLLKLPSRRQSYAKIVQIAANRAIFIEKRPTPPLVLRQCSFPGVCRDKIAVKTFDYTSATIDVSFATVRMARKKHGIRAKFACPYSRKNCHKAVFSCHKASKALNMKEERPPGPPFFYLCTNITRNGRNIKDKLPRLGWT